MSNQIVFSLSIVLCLQLITADTVWTQTYKDAYIQFEDSLFVDFESPDSSLWRHEESAFHVAVLVQIDTAGTVYNIQTFPLRGLGPGPGPTDTLWSKIESEIKRVSKKWRFKPYFHSHEEVPETVRDLCCTPPIRPYSGYQQHFILLSFNPISSPTGPKEFVNRMYHIEFFD